MNNPLVGMECDNNLVTYAVNEILQKKSWFPKDFQGRCHKHPEGNALCSVWLKSRYETYLSVRISKWATNKNSIWKSIRRKYIWTNNHFKNIWEKHEQIKWRKIKEKSITMWSILWSAKQQNVQYWKNSYTKPNLWKIDLTCLDGSFDLTWPVGLNLYKLRNF